MTTHRPATRFVDEVTGGRVETLDSGDYRAVQVRTDSWSGGETNRGTYHTHHEARAALNLAIAANGPRVIYPGDAADH